MYRPPFRILAFAGLLLLLSAAAPPDLRWTRAWTASPWRVPPDKLTIIEDVTIRAAVRVNAGGSAIRLRLSNAHGDQILRIAGATVRLAQGFDIGDHIHPNAAGQTRMGQAVPLALFR